MTTMNNYLSTIVIMGDGGVGKTSLVNNFIKGYFSEEYISTVGCVTSSKQLEFGENQLKLLIRDVPGQDVNLNLTKINFRGAKGAIVVYDCTRKSTFERLDHWIGNLYEVTGEVPIIILGNKHDILKAFEKEKGIEAAQTAPKEEFDSFVREQFPQVPEFYKKHEEFGIPDFEAVSLFTLIKYAKRGQNPFNKKFPYFQSSALTGDFIEEAFEELGKTILENILESE